MYSIFHKAISLLNHLQELLLSLSSSQNISYINCNNKYICLTTEIREKACVKVKVALASDFITNKT